MTIRVLLADDQNIMSLALIGILGNDKDLDVIGTAENGEIAVRMASELSPDLIVMDIGMPVLDGIEAARLIRKEKPDIKILAVSMYSDPQIVRDMVKAGASGYLPKDDAFEELLPAIHAVMTGHTYFPSKISDFLNDY